MTEVGVGALRLEAAEDAGSVLAAYDRSASDWAFPRIGEFWEVVAEAHRRGITGRGRRVAIIDSAFDLSFGSLRLACGGAPKLRARAGETASHGTAVALLVSTVAPDAQLDLYEATTDGEPDVHAVRMALRLIAQSDADVVCLSLGAPVDLAGVEVRPDYALGASMEGYLDGWLAVRGRQTVQVKACPLPVCLCEAVTAVGFQTASRWDPGVGDAAVGLPPGFSQSIYSDLTLRQPDGVDGSSFAAPLAAGAAALGFSPDAAHSFAASSRLCANADLILAAMHGLEPRQGLVERMVRLHDAALEEQPHIRELWDGEHWCVECALYSTPLVINAGLAALMFGWLERAEKLLRIGRRLAPANPHACANLARTLFEQFRADPRPERSSSLAEAVALYDQAIALRPDADEYRPVRDEIARELERAVSLRQAKT